MENATILDLVKNPKSELQFNDGERIRTERWSVSQFLTLVPFIRNRPVEQRVKKKRDELKRGFLLTHLEVKVGRVTKAFGNYRVNDLFIIDGNTRALVWLKYPELWPLLPLLVTIMDFEEEENSINTYYSIDSSSSVETSQEKIGGYFRSIEYVPTSRKVKDGKISTTINDATKYIRYFGEIPQKQSTIFNKIEHVWTEFRFIDECNLDYIKNLSSNLFTCMIMIGKKYGIKDERFVKMIEYIKDGTIELDDNHYCDGVCYVMTCLFRDNFDKWHITGHKKAPELMYEMLYSLDLFMRNILLKKKKNYSVVKHQKYREFFQSYFN